MSGRQAAIVTVAFVGGVAAALYGVWLWVDRGLGRIRW